MKSALKRTASRAATVCLSALFPLTAVASDHDFNAAVSSIESTYHVRRQHIPMIGLASFCVHMASGGAVKGVEIAEFDEGAKLPDGADLPKLLQRALGSEWSLMVDDFGNGEQDAIFTRTNDERNEGNRIVMLVASYDHGDFSVVRVSLDGAQLAKWMKDPVGHARRVTD